MVGWSVGRAGDASGGGIITIEATSQLTASTKKVQYVPLMLVIMRPITLYFPITNKLGGRYCTFFVQAGGWEVALMVTVPPPDATPTLFVGSPSVYQVRQMAL